MFEEEKNIEKYSLSITIGLKISHEMINEKIKFNLESLTENHLNYLDLDKENKNKEILITIKNKVNEKGMISKTKDKNGRSFNLRTTDKFAEYFKLKGDVKALAKILDLDKNLKDNSKKSTPEEPADTEAEQAADAE